MKENKLIAEFMGMANERHSDGRYLFTTDIDELNGTDTRFWEELYFHVSWDWLMPVVERIEQVMQGVPQQMLHLSLYSTIDEVYAQVVEFIKEYNQIKQKR